MSKDLCKDCGMILPADTTLCSVCGFDNDLKDSEFPILEDYPHAYMENVAPENYPGF